ncbi:MAG: spore germination protein [Bacilli bacterium]
MNTPIPKSLEKNQDWLQEHVLLHCQDVKPFSFLLGDDSAARFVRVWGVYLDGSTDLEQMMQTFMPLFQETFRRGPYRSLHELRDHLSAPDVAVTQTWERAEEALFGGQALLFLDGYEGALTVDKTKKPERTPDDPPIETSIRGPRDGLVENIVDNVALIRKRLPTSHLCCEYFFIGRRSHTRIALLYMQDVARPSLVDAIRHRLSADTDMDELTESSHLEELLEDRAFTLFPTFDSTQRADKSAAVLSEGRVVLVTDNLPTALIAPATLLQLLQSVDDYQDRFPFATMTRILRWTGLFVALVLPSIYVASTEYHQDTLPVFLLLSLVSAHRGVPFPTPIEAFMMLGIFELFREAGLRLPRAAGQTVGIIGTVVVGDAAVRAGLASTGMLVVMGITAVSTFTIPNFTLSNAVSLLRFLFLFMASVFGDIGIVLGIVLLVAHWAGLRSFGVSYLAPFSPFEWSDWKDAFIRIKWTRMKVRPRSLRTTDRARRRSRQK